MYKSEGLDDHNSIMKWFKKCCSICKNFKYHEMSGKPKTIDSETVFLAREQNPASITQRVLGEICIPCDTMSWIYAPYMYTHVCVCIYIYTHIYMWQDELDSAWVSNFKC